MSTFTQHYLFVFRAACAALVLGLALPFTATAQDQQFQLEEIIVTAQKRAQLSQDVPIAISAFSQNDLDSQQIDDALDLQFSVPNLVYNLGEDATLRGIGNRGIGSSSEGGLGFHINGVYLIAPRILETEFYDVDRIEVLRGPQGTLFGRNTTAGVVNIVTRKPGDELGGNFSISAGDYGLLKAKGGVDIPLSDNISQRFAFYYLSRDGFIENIGTGNDIDDRNSYAFRSSTRLSLSDNTTADLVISYFEEDDKRQILAKGACSKDPAYGCSPLANSYDAPDSRVTIFHLLGGAVGLLPDPGADFYAGYRSPVDVRTLDWEIDPTYEADETFVSLEINHTFGDLTFTSVTGAQQTEFRRAIDFDQATSDVVLTRPVTYRRNFVDTVTTTSVESNNTLTQDAEQFSQEFRLTSDLDGAFNYIVGAYYLDFEVDTQYWISQSLFAGYSQALGLDPELFEWFRIESEPLTTKSWAVFAEGTYDISDQTRLFGGLRYSDDEKSIRTRTVFANLANPAWIEAKESWDTVTGRIGVDHRINDDVLLFGTLSRGYKGGGLNPGNVAAPSYDPEYLNAIEFGVKSTLADGRLRANFSAFYYDYSDLQLGQVAETSALTVNSDATIMGAEAEFVYSPIDNLVLDLNLAFLETEIEDFQTADQGDIDAIAPGAVPLLDSMGNPVRRPPSTFTPNGEVIQILDGKELRNSPNFSGKFGVEYTFELENGWMLAPRADVMWRGETYATEFNKPTDTMQNFAMVDAQIRLSNDSSPWAFRAFVKNALDDDAIVRITQEGPLVGRFRNIFALEPMTFGVEVSANFD